MIKHKNSILFLKKILKLTVIVFFSQNLLFAESIRDDLDNFFSEAYEFTGGFCEPNCRKLSEPNKYMTKLIDFDASTGVSV